MRFHLLTLLALVGIMTGAVMAQPQSKVPTLLDYKDKLGLKPAQVTSIQKALAEFQSQARDLSPQLQAAQKQLNTDLQKHADLATIHTHLEAMHNLRCKLDFADISVARRIEDALTAEQRQQWRQLQTAAQQQKKN